MDPVPSGKKPLRYRWLPYAVGMAILGGAVALVLLYFHFSNREMEMTVQGMMDQIKSEQQDHLPVDPAQIEARMQTLKNMADQSNTPEASVMSAVASLSLELVDKVKAAQAAEQDAREYNPALITSRDDLASQMESISTLRTKQADVLSFLQNFYEHIRTVLLGAGIGPNDINDLITRTRQGRDLSPFIALQQSKVKLADDRLAQLHFLDQNWGRWHAQNGQVLFTDQSAQSTFNNLTATLQADAAQGESPQK